MAVLIAGLSIGAFGWRGNGCTISNSTYTNDLSVELPADGHLRMVAILKRLRDLPPESANPMGGAAQITRLKRELAVLPKNAPADEVFRRHFLLGKSYLIEGQTEWGIKEFEKCYEIYEKIKRVVPNPQMIQDRLDYEIAVAYIRLGENENCVNCRNGNSCILPIRDEGVHKDKRGATTAIQFLNSFLERNPDNWSARWLINIAYMTVGDYPHNVPQQWRIEPEAYGSVDNFPRFSNVGKKVGIDVLSNAGGMVVEDFNGDGWLDVMASDLDTGGQLRCHYSNRDGTFTEATSKAGLDGLYGGLNLVHADYDNDGDFDILVTRGAWLLEKGRDHPNSLLQNNGQGRFRDVTFESGLGNEHWPTQTASFADYDNDGDLDLFVGNEIGPCQLYQNDGHGYFKDVAGVAGVAEGGLAKGVAWGDYDNDRYPDLYISNYSGANFLYHNNGDGTFRNVAKEAGVEHPTRSFPTWFWDYDNDGSLDLYVGAYWPKLHYFAEGYLNDSQEAETDRVFQGDGKGKFLDVSEQLNVNHVTLPMGANFGDLDNDGYPDYYLGTGFPDYAALLPNRMFYNEGGRRFRDVTTAGGFGHLQKGHGISFADFDHDGDQDVFVELGGLFRGDAFGNTVFENPGFGNHWIVIKLTGVQSNRSGAGARIRATIEESGNTRDVYKWVDTGGSFGCNPMRQHLGLGAAAVIRELEIYWPTSDTTQQFEKVKANQMIEIVEGEKEFRALRITN